jgi:hypothetical protein
VAQHCGLGRTRGAAREQKDRDLLGIHAPLGARSLLVRCAREEILARRGDHAGALRELWRAHGVRHEVATA